MKMLGGTCLCVALVLFCASAAAQPADVKGSARTQSLEDHAAVKRARAFTTWMAWRSNRVQRWLWQARYKQDRARMRCLNRRLSRLHAIERLGRSGERAVVSAVRSGGLTGHHMVRLVHLHDASRAQLAAASGCRQKVSKRVRMPTQYTVRVIRTPALHEAPKP